MKTSKLINVAWVIFALVLTTTSVFAQGGRRANAVQNNQNLPCLIQISDLTEEQKTSIQELEATHQKTMDELRTTRRATVNAVEKSEIRTEMLKNVEAHRNEVKSVLSEEQQVQYDQLHANGSFGRNQNVGRGQGKGRGKGGRSGYTNNNGCGNRNNSGRGVNCSRTANS